MLRSLRDLEKYTVRATDGDIGSETRALRYLVIDASNWWFGKKVLLAPNWSTDVRSAELVASLVFSPQPSV